MTMIHNTPVRRPIRYRRARSDASLGTLQEEIEKKFGLPPGSVRIVRPDGRKMRTDATVCRLRTTWDN